MYLPKLWIEERVNNFVRKNLPFIDEYKHIKNREQSIFFSSTYLSENKGNIKNLVTYHFNDARFDNWIPLFFPQQNKILLEDSKYLAPEQNIVDRDLFETLNAEYEDILRKVWEKYNYPLVDNKLNYSSLLREGVSREIIYEIVNKLLEDMPDDKSLYLLSEDWYVCINICAEEALEDLDFHEDRKQYMNFYQADIEGNGFLWFYIGDKTIKKEDEKFEPTLAYCFASSYFLDLIILSDTSTYAITWVPFRFNSSGIFESADYVDYILSH